MNMKFRTVLVMALGWLCGTCAFALEKVDGVYQIASAADLVEFATLVNGGENAANAALTADIDMTDVAWTPIGNSNSRFAGTFDGQYHTIDHLKYESSEERIGIFGVVDGGCVIKNFIAGPANEIRGTSKVGGIIGCSDGSGWVTLENVGHEGYVYGTGNNVCAIIGVVMNGGPATRITNCYNMGNVSGGGESAIIAGWFGGHGSVEVRGFWNTGIMESGQDGSNSLWRNGSGITTERIFHLYGDQGASIIEEGDLTSGKLAFALNDYKDAGFWKQNLTDPVDLHPTFLPGHLSVYANGELACDGSAKEGSSVTYSNTEGSVRDEHQFVAGFCSVCGLMQENFCQMEDDHYIIDDGDKLNWFAYMVNNVNGAANARLTADIDMTAKAFTPIGQDAHDFKGHFDGGGHRILNLVTNADRNNQALFGQAVGGAVIENVIIDASCLIQGTAFTAGILGHVWGDGVIVRNCGNEANIYGSAQNAAGIVGCSEKEVHISNCYNIGEIQGSHENAGICAWMGANNSTIKNCYSTATGINGAGLWRKDEVVGENVYQIEGIQGTAFSEEQMKSGELAYMLNGKQSETVEWYQVIGTDSHPMPIFIEGGVVYANGALDCAGNAKEGADVTYSNTEGATRDDHHFENGICSVCGTPDTEYIKAEDGNLMLASAADVVWFAAMVNKVDASLNAMLAADIDFNGVDFQGIATAAAPFSGTFDGQRHIVSNLVIYMPEEANVGFFREITAGAHIMNFTIDATCSINGKNFVGAFIGHVSGNGKATLEQLGNEASVSTIDQNAGGIVGCNTSGELKLTLLNCYNAGVISSGWEAGGLSGWLGNDAITTNCYNMGVVNNGESFARGNNIQITNCFDPVTDWPALPVTPIENFTNDVVYNLLAEAAPGIWFLSAEIDGHPVLYDTGIVSGISRTTVNNDNGNVYYDLQGRKVESPSKGIYILNGHKIVVR